MKYRSDYVTNSSSSSFIISSENPFLVTCEDVYSYMKELFKQLSSQRELVLNKFGGDIMSRFWKSKDDGGFDMDRNVANYIKSLYHFDISSDYSDPNYWKWIDKCETYDDFLNYQGFNKKTGVQLPFEIIDFAECDIDTVINIASWYISCIGDDCCKQRGREPGFCDFDYCELNNRYACDEIHGKSGEELREYIVKYLGRWCIYVDEGAYLPLFIRDKAEILCEYYNWHMG